ncbi:MAG: activator of (R)-2-hydroxyglutaryl-CoA dehydratase [Deltaproteobacteria bacterium]|nr:activator of (R)-2-hydroxyglutaryl-CoA dehydratase [Deltaproteobacteria bacterium]
MGEQQHYRLRQERPFLRRERETTTILCGGLTWAHERLIEVGLRALGYRVEILPNVDRAAHDTGRKYCSNGLCNPAYFTIGNLVRRLQRLRDDEGLSAQQIIDRYVFFTAGSAGPCRFGMYESEYRLALEAAGFAGFRVLVFQQSGGPVQSLEPSGIDFSMPFFHALLRGMMVGDIANDLYHQHRPFERERGASAAARRRMVEALVPVMAPLPAGPGRRAVDWLTGLTWLPRPVRRTMRWLSAVALLLEQRRSEQLVQALAAAAASFEQVALDRLRLAPLVKVTGEFWAQTTESDGNFNMFEQLERLGAEVLAEPLTTWIAYLIHVARVQQRRRLGVPDRRARTRLGRAWSRLLSPLRVRWTTALLDLAERVLVGEYDRLRAAVSGRVLPLVDQRELERLADRYYDPRLRGGEGHLEIGKTIHYAQSGHCHLVLSLKPFGCMPSTQSDGAQPAVLAEHPSILFLPIETAADGEGNALSRVQMALSEARQRARAEWRSLWARSSYAPADLCAFLATHPELQRAPLPFAPGQTATAVRLAALACEQMQAAGIRPLQVPAEERPDAVSPRARDEEQARLQSSPAPASASDWLAATRTSTAAAPAPLRGEA